MLARGMGGYGGPMKSLRKVTAAEILREMKKYKDSYRTFPHMTSPYVYPVGGFGSSLASAMAGVVQDGGGATEVGRPVASYLRGDDGACRGVTMADGVTVKADCVIAAPEHAVSHATVAHHVVRLYAVLAHPPNLCKDSTSCQLLLPAAHTGREHDIYMVSVGPTHGVAPKGRWVVVASARVEGPTDGLSALAVAKRELAAVLPLLKPSRKLLAEVTPVYEPNEEAQLEALHVLSSCDESSYLDSVEADVEDTFAAITGERIGTPRRRAAA